MEQQQREDFERTKEQLLPSFVDPEGGYWSDHEEELEYEVERILGVRAAGVGGGREFLVKWKGFGVEANTWEPEGNLGCGELVEEFWARHGGR